MTPLDTFFAALDAKPDREPETIGRMLGRDELVKILDGFERPHGNSTAAKRSS